MAKTFTPEVKFDAKKLHVNVHSIDKRVGVYVGAVVDYTTKRAEGEMRKNAPWTDRTGNARQGLTASSFHQQHVNGTEHIIALYHRVPYGIWLEVANAGKYRIIIPTLQSAGKDLMRRIGKLLDRVGKTP